jgi:hypothetical protein
VRKGRKKPDREVDVFIVVPTLIQHPKS